MKPVNEYNEEIIQVFENMTDTDDETNETRSDSSQLCYRILKYDFLTWLGLWNKVLIRIDCVQKRLQVSSMNDAALDLKPPRDHFDLEREILVSESLEEWLGLSQEWNIEVERRRRPKKRVADENPRGARITVRWVGKIHESNTRLSSQRNGLLLDVEGL